MSKFSCMNYHHNVNSVCIFNFTVSAVVPFLQETLKHVELNKEHSLHVLLFLIPRINSSCIIELFGSFSNLIIFSLQLNMLRNSSLEDLEYVDSSY